MLALLKYTAIIFAQALFDKITITRTVRETATQLIFCETDMEGERGGRGYFLRCFHVCVCIRDIIVSEIARRSFRRIHKCHKWRRIKKTQRKKVTL